MAVEWTTAQIVRDLLGGITTSSISNGIIEEYIEQWEGYAEARYKVSDITFASTKKMHKIIRSLVTHYAAMDLIVAVNMSFETLNQAALSASVIKDQIIQIERALDDRTVMQSVRDA